MKRRLSPQEKKRLAYDRDHISLGWHSGTSFRKGWRKKEAAMEQAHRRAWRVATHELAKTEDPDASYPQGRIRRRSVRKTRPPTLRALVARKLERRVGSHGAKARRATERAAAAVVKLEQLLENILKVKVVPAVEPLRDLETLVVMEARYIGLPRKMVLDYLQKHPGWGTRLRKWRRAILKRQGMLDKRNANRK